MVEIATSYDNKVYDEKPFDYLCKERYGIDWEVMLEDADKYTDEIKELHDMAHDMAVATGFLASSDKRIYGKILNNLENDSINESNSNYLKDIASALDA